MRDMIGYQCIDWNCGIAWCRLLLQSLSCWGVHQTKTAGSNGSSWWQKVFMLSSFITRYRKSIEKWAGLHFQCHLPQWRLRDLLLLSGNKKWQGEYCTCGVQVEHTKETRWRKILCLFLVNQITAIDNNLKCPNHKEWIEETMWMSFGMWRSGFTWK